jgi:hypothetical protein
MRLPGFIGPSYTLQSRNVDCQRCIGLYPEVDELGTGKAGEVAALNSTPGLGTLVTIGAGPIRAEYTASNGTLYAVSGNQLCSVSNSWSYTVLGTLNTSVGPVSIADNGLVVCVVDGSFGYFWNLSTSTFTQITDPNFFPASQTCYFDDYFVFNMPGTGQLYASSPAQTDTVPFPSPPMIADIQSGSTADPLLAMSNSHENFWLFGSTHAEVWYDAGNAPPLIPFAPISGAISEIGTGAAFSVARMNNTVFWLGADDKGQGIVYMANGYVPQRISTHAIEYALKQYSTLADATAYCYQENGHSFYVLNFTAGNATWVYDMITGFWHERAFTSLGQINRHRGQVHAFAYGVHVVGDYQNGNLYQMSSTINSDFGNPITRRRSAPHIVKGMDRIYYNSFQLDLETGVGLDGIGQGTNPQVVLRWSDDGGYTWSNEKWVGFGKIGQRKARALWRRLGQSRDRVFEVTITDPVIVTLIGAEVDLAPGGN